jgi:hypothetical protein
MTKREANQVLLAHWTHSWTTLGRWQELNSRLSREPAPAPGWMRSTASSSSWRAAFQKPAGSRFGDLGVSE